MSLQKGWSHWTGRAVVLAQDNIDTDQIYPGRFLSLTNRAEMPPAFFADWRFDSSGQPRTDSPFEAGLSVLVAGENFGCGSSREHAVWVMRDHGYRVVLARSFAPIFKQNAVANGLAPIEISETDYRALTSTPDARFEVTVDLEMGQGLLFSKSPLILQLFSFSLDPFDIHCLRNGVDSLGYLLSVADETHEFVLKKDRRHSLHTYMFKGEKP